ncbi:hypothetical protein PGT21_014094 [Puccinia graminis f. sp. tritici]|uniref:Uncharacterized protein n=1 Tax=Puccinia graminis f. sp. tritici TaxID=56615 RepID=A0A5B0QFV6_PUCGR|nr:hypothetical protein PGT21_014094 [Puccinia graminis f. sp. tritici]
MRRTIITKSITITNTNNSQPFRTRNHQLKKKKKKDSFQRHFSSDSGPQADPYSICLCGLPASFVPTDVRRFVSRFISDPGSLQKVIYVPDPTVPWTLQTNLLRFTRPESVAEMGQEVEKMRGWRRGEDEGGRSWSEWSEYEDLPPPEAPEVALEKVGKHWMGRGYEQALEHQAREVSWLNSRSALLASTPSPHPKDNQEEEEALGHRPGRAVLLVGLPLHSDPLQIENTLLNFGFPVLRAQSLAAYERLLRRLYWPFLDPSPSYAVFPSLLPSPSPLSILKLQDTNNTFLLTPTFGICQRCLSNRMARPKKNDSKKKTSRAQVVYTPSLTISNHLVGELNHLVPSWLGSRVSKNSELLGLPSSGWKLKAKVLY